MGSNEASDAPKGPDLNPKRVEGLRSGEPH